MLGCVWTGVNFSIFFFLINHWLLLPLPVELFVSQNVELWDLCGKIYDSPSEMYFLFLNVVFCCGWKSTRIQWAFLGYRLVSCDGFLTYLINLLVRANLQWLMKKENSSKVIHYKEIMIWLFPWSYMLFTLRSNSFLFMCAARLSVVFKLK